MKRILNVILYTTIRITGVAGVIWFFVSSAATLELVINGADMTTWEKDPYIFLFQTLPPLPKERIKSCSRDQRLQQ